MCRRQTARQATSSVAYVGEEPADDDPLLGFAPSLHPAPRSNSILPHLQQRFIATLAATGIVNQAARSIGKSMEALYKLRGRRGAEGFAAAWDAALERGVRWLEDCALERAIRGTPTPIVSGGQLLGTCDRPDNNIICCASCSSTAWRIAMARGASSPAIRSMKASASEVLAEEGKNRLARECSTIESINAKIDKQAAFSKVMTRHRELGEMDEALGAMGWRRRR